MQQPGATINGRYRVIRLLGQGGMSNIYICEDLHLSGKIWAVKEFTARYSDPQEQAVALQHFGREANLLATLSHPNLPTVTDYFPFQGQQYLVMEYVEGEDLDKILERAKGPLPVKQVVEWFLQMTTVLYYLHCQKPQPIIFRDVKPSNIIISHGQVKLIDFGIARHFNPGKKGDTMRIGSPGYAPPEQYNGQTDPRSDIFALGATMHQALTGRDPTASPTPFVFPPIRSLNPGVPQALEEIIAKAVKLRPEERYQTMLDLKKDLRARLQSELSLGSTQPNMGLPGSALTPGLPVTAAVPTASPPPPPAKGMTVPHPAPAPQSAPVPQPAGSPASPQQSPSVTVLNPDDDDEGIALGTVFKMGLVVIILCLGAILFFNPFHARRLAWNAVSGLIGQASGIKVVPLTGSNMYLKGSTPASCISFLTRELQEEPANAALRIYLNNSRALDGGNTFKLGLLVSKAPDNETTFFKPESALTAAATLQEFLASRGGWDGQQLVLDFVVSDGSNLYTDLYSLATGHAGRCEGGSYSLPRAILVLGATPPLPAEHDQAIDVPVYLAESDALHPSLRTWPQKKELIGSVSQEQTALGALEQAIRSSHPQASLWVSQTLTSATPQPAQDKTSSAQQSSPQQVNLKDEKSWQAYLNGAQPKVCLAACADWPLPPTAQALSSTKHDELMLWAPCDSMLPDGVPEGTEALCAASLQGFAYDDNQTSASTLCLAQRQDEKGSPFGGDAGALNAFDSLLCLCALSGTGDASGLRLQVQDSHISEMPYHLWQYSQTTGWTLKEAAK